MIRELRKERERLKKQSINLRDLAFDAKGEKVNKLREQQNDKYNQWKFYDNFIKAQEKIEKNN